VFAAYLLGGKIGLMVPFTSGNVSAVWPAAGVAMAALLLVGYRVWPSIAAAALLVNFFTAIPALAALGMAAGDTAGPLVGVWLMRRTPSFNVSLACLTDVGTILVAAPLSAAVSASIGVAVLFGTGVNPWLTVADAWRVWWLGDSMGMLIVTPVVLTFPGRKLHSVREVAELGTLLVAATVTSLVMFKPALNIQSGIVLAAAVMPFVLWGAVRFETRGATLVVLLVSCVVVWETHLGAGPFVSGTAAHAAALLQALLAMIAVSGLTLAAAIAEKSHLIRERAHREGVAESERKYRRIVETANDGIWMLDGHLVTIFANQRLAELLGYTVAEMDGRSLFDFLFEEDSRQKAAELQRWRQSASEHLQTRFRRKDGSELWALVSRTSTFDEDGRLIGVLKMISDITDQRRAERDSQLARETVLLLSEAVNQTADSVVVTDSSGRIEYVNRAFETTTGYTREEALGKTPRLLKSGHHDSAFYGRMWDVLLSGQTFRGTLVNSRKNGERYWAEQTITPIKDVQGTTTHFISVLKDVTVARQHQEQQIQLRLAREVQQRFYRATVQVPGFDIAAAAYPAEQTGGDYFDFIHVADGPCYVSIGDVSGHGLDAALVMAMTRGYVRSFATLGLDVAEILARVNEVLVEDLTENRFVTLLLARLDPGSRKLEYANAGHVPGFVLNRTGDTEAVMHSTGVPLGLFSGSVFSTRTFWLEAGQIMVLCTDGATETSRGGEEEYGCERVLDDVRAHRHRGAREIAESIYRAVRTFAAGEPQHDDITSVIVKVQ
jgi:PAS domain S-box-containing protein